MCPATTDIPAHMSLNQVITDCNLVGLSHSITNVHSGQGIKRHVGAAIAYLSGDTLPQLYRLGEALQAPPPVVRKCTCTI